MAQSFHCELAWLGDDVADADVLVEIDGDRITAVTRGVAAPRGATRLAGLTVPGLANSHSHAFHRALRGRTQAGHGSFWTWRTQMYAVADTLDPDSYHRLARAVFGEMVLAGITSVGEFHYLHHAPGGVQYSDPNAMGAALVAAAREAGLRLTLLDACYLHGGVGRPLDETQRRFADADVGAWAERADAADSLRSATVRTGAAVHSVRAVDPRSIEVVAQWAAHRDAPLHVHVSEQPAENEQCVEAHGCTPSALLAACGALGERSTAVHAIHLTDDDVRLLGDTGTCVCVCPTTERDLADGIAPAHRLSDAGARLALGSDSHAVIDMFEEARAMELDERLASLSRGRLDVVTLLHAATAGGHRSIGWPEAGRIAAGAIADLVTVRLDSPRTAGTTRSTALAHALFAASAADVVHVVASGRVLVANGEHVAIDVPRELGTILAELDGR